MKKTVIAWIALALVVGWVGGVAAAKKSVSPALYRELPMEEAAANLLAKALEQAEDESWENLAVARVYYLAGDTERGQGLIDRVTSRKMDKSDWMRAGRLYLDAGDWEKAEDAFGKALALGPKDEDILAEVGAYYNLRGQREQAESYFDRAFAESPKDFWVTVEIAGSYLGVKPPR